MVKWLNLMVRTIYYSSVTILYSRIVMIGMYNISNIVGSFCRNDGEVDDVWLVI